MKNLLVFILLVIINKVYSCDCASAKGLSQEIQIRDYIFTCKILSKDSVTLVDSAALNFINSNPGIIRKGWPVFYNYMRYEVKSLEILKGSLIEDTLVLYIPIVKNTCEHLFDLNEDYIVYGNKLNESFIERNIFPNNSNIILIDHCTRTKKVNATEISRLKKLI